jgi:hypothetical protein
VVVFVASAMLASACGGSGSSAGTTGTTAIVSSSAETMTTAESPDLRPWRMVPIPQPPAVELTTGFGGPLTVDKVRLMLDFEGPIDAASQEDGLRGDLELMGVGVVDGDTPVSIEVAIAAERIPAEYSISTGTTTCWTGFRIEGWVTVSIDEVIAGASRVEKEQPPLAQMSSCAAADDRLWVGEDIDEALRQAFGVSAELATEASKYIGPGTSYFFPGDPLIGNDALDTVLAGLYHPDERVRGISQEAVKERFSQLQWLPPADADAIPVLIAALDYYLEQGWPIDTLRNGLRGLLRASTGADQLPAGFDENCPADWWLLWQDEWELSAPCDRLGDS